MRVLRILRGIVGTALSFAVPWAIFGGAFLVVIELVWNGPLSSHGPFYLVKAAAFGATQFGIVGGFVGAAFAAILAVAGRRITFDQLTAPRVLSVGLVGTLAVCGSLFTLLALMEGSWGIGHSVAMGISAVLGGGSAVAMLQIARTAGGALPHARPQLSSSPPDAHAE